MAKLTRFMKITFIFYIGWLFIFVVVKFSGLSIRISSIKQNIESGVYNYNLVPFRSLGYYFQNITEPFGYTNILGNMICFLPLGFLLPFVFKRAGSFVNTIVVCFITILGIEIFQLITMVGYFDMDDIILNTLGCLIGRSVFGIFQYFFGERGQKKFLASR